VPSTFLAGSKPRSVPPTPVVLSVCESTIPALETRGPCQGGAVQALAQRAVQALEGAFSMRHLLNQW
jgi:hypothetical protein